jgi:hypothetical protein
MGLINYHLNINDLNIEFSDVLNILQVTDNSPDNPVVYESIQLFGQLKNIANIQGGYFIHNKIEVDIEKGIINIKGMKINPQKQICGYMKNSEKIALFVCTAGEGFSVYSNQYNKKGDYLKGFIVDSMGSLVVEKSMDFIQKKLEEEVLLSGIRITNRYSPGYCDWKVQDQQQLFGLLPENPYNISLSESSLMIPIKSVSGIIGIGKNVRKRKYSCDICRNSTCIYRKVKSSLIH